MPNALLPLLAATMLGTECPPGGRIDPPPPPPVEYWTLPTGSRIAYVRLPGTGIGPRPVLIHLHGGPGASQVSRFMAGRKWWDRLARLGFDVYLYDQVGSGLSGRLDDPIQYTVRRQVDDLEAIRATIGTDRMVLIGESWGASLAAHYIAAHPERVERAIFVSPGAIDRPQWDLPPTAPCMHPGMLAWVRDKRGAATHARTIELQRLLRVDVKAAYAFAGDTDMDRLFDAWISQQVLPETLDGPPRYGEVLGMGWWASTMTNWDRLARAAPVHDALARFAGPVLILHGVWDYLSPEIADDYAAAFRDARLVHVSRAGHLIWADRPDAYKGEIVKFLKKPPRAPDSQVLARAATGGATGPVPGTFPARHPGGSAPRDHLFGGRAQCGSGCEPLRRYS